MSDEDHAMQTVTFENWKEFQGKNVRFQTHYELVKQSENDMALHFEGRWMDATLLNFNIESKKYTFELLNGEVIRRHVIVMGALRILSK